MTVDPKVYHLAAHWLGHGDTEKNVVSLAEAIQTAIEDWELAHKAKVLILLIVPYILIA